MYRHVTWHIVYCHTLTLFYEQDLELAREASCKLGKLRIILRSCTLQLAAVDGYQKRETSCVFGLHYSVLSIGTRVSYRQMPLKFLLLHLCARCVSVCEWFALWFRSTEHSCARVATLLDTLV